MRKYAFLLCLIILLILGLTACTGEGDPSPSQSTLPDNTVESQVPVSPDVGEDPSPDTQLPVLPLPSSPEPTIIYVNNQLKFQLQLPASWEGLYEVVEEDGAVSFVNVKNSGEGFGGVLFTILVTDEVPEDIPDESMEYQMLAFFDGMEIGIVMPKGLQYNGDDSTLAQEYQSMAQDIDAIKETVIAIP